jgi:hypothetical protein
MDRRNFLKTTGTFIAGATVPGLRLQAVRQRVTTPKGER